MSPDTSSSPAALLLLAPLVRAPPAGLAARLLAAPPLRATDGPASPGSLFFAKYNFCPADPRPFSPPSSLTGVPLAALPRGDPREPEAARDMAGELSRRRRSPLLDGPAATRLSASDLLPAAGEPFGLGVEVVLPFMMFSLVSP